MTIPDARSPWALLAPLAAMAGLWWLSSIPGQIRPDDPEIYSLFVWVPPNLQNLLHVPAYAALAWVWAWYLEPRTASRRAAALAAFIVAVLYGLTDEWHQSFVPMRYASATDALSNAVGAGLAIFLWLRRAPDATVPR